MGYDDHKGKYNIPPHEHSVLFELVADHTGSSRCLTLVERHTGLGVSPLLIDLDFTHPPGSPRQYTRAQVARFVARVHSTLCEFHDLPQGCVPRYVLAEKPAPTPKTAAAVKDGLHILAPDLVLPYATLYRLRAALLQRKALQDAFREMWMTEGALLEGADKVLDVAVIESNGWFLCGAGKKGRAAYAPTALFVPSDPSDSASPVLEGPLPALSPSEWVAWLSVRNKPLATPVLLKEAWRDDWERLPADGKTAGRVARARPSAAPPSAPPSVTFGGGGAGAGAGSVAGLTAITGAALPSCPLTFTTLQQLVALWSNERAEGFETWRNAIFCIGGACRAVDKAEEALPMALAFSQRAPHKFSAATTAEVKQLLASANGSLGFATAQAWARADSPQDYAARFVPFWKAPWAHFNIAKLFHGMFEDRFLYCRGAWFVYTGVYWKKDPGDARTGCMEMKRMLSRDLYDALHAQLMACRDVMEPETLQRKLSDLTSLLQKGTKDCVSEELKQLYDQPDVAWDAHPGMFAFSNRVYDLSGGRFVEARPEQYISMTTGYDHSDSSNAEVAECEAWVESLFESPLKTRYVLKLLSTCLYRNNVEERAHFLLGAGRNGKGTLRDRMAAALGPAYHGGLTLSYLTAPDKASDGPNPHLYNLRHARAVWVDEAQTEGRGIGGKVVTGRLKALTGRDKVKARPLFSNEEAEFEMGHFLALVNEMPTFTSVDYALLLRLVAVVFPFRFLPSHEYNAADPQHRPQNAALKDAILGQRVAFVNMLLKWHAVYRVEGLVPPEEVLAETRAVTAELDHVGAYVRANLVVRREAKTPLRAVYTAYVASRDGADEEAVSVEEFGKRVRRCGLDVKYAKIEGRSVNCIINYVLNLGKE